MKKQKFISKKWFILLAVVVFLIPVAVYAQPASTTATTAAGQAASVFNDALSAMVGFLSQVLKLMQKILWPIFMAIGGLMNNDLLFGAGMEERLLSIWAQIRNLVNIIFVVALVGIALYNVTGFTKEGDYQMKTFLPKLVIALILVNFTFIGLKFILDVSNVLTNVVFTLPSSISADLQNTQLYLPDNAQLQQFKTDNNLSDDDIAKIQSNIDKVCKSMFGPVSDMNTKVIAYNNLPANQKDPNQDPAKFYCKVATSGKTYELTENGRKFFKQYTSRNSPMVLAVQMMKVVDIDKVSDTLKQAKPEISTLFFNLLFSVIIYIIYAVAYIVLFVVLLGRLVFLWIIIALSPVVALKIVFSKLPTGDKDYLSMFLTNAFVPVLIGIPLTIGYIMLGALQQASSPITNDFNWNSAFSLETSGVSDLQTMVIAFGSVAVIWVGVFAAAEKSIASSVVGAIKSRVIGAGRALARATRFLPVIPAAAGTKGRASFQQLSNLFTAPLRNLQQRYGGEVGGGPVSQYNIEALGRRGKTGTPQELKQYLAQGITIPRYQAPLAKVIRGWGRGTAEQQRTREQVLRAGFGTVAAGREFERTGKLTGEQARNIQQWAQGQIASPLGTPVRRPAAGTKPTAAQRTATANTQKAQQINDAATLGYIPANDQRLQTAKAGGAGFEAYVKDKNNAGDLKTFAAISAAKSPLSSARNVAAEVTKLPSITEKSVKPVADRLKTQIAAAKKSMQDQKLDKAKIKDVLQKVVESQLGDKQTAFYGTDSGKAVRDLINN